MSVREQLEAALKPLLPKGWKIVPYQDNVDEVSSVTIMFKLLKMENFKEAPLRTFNYSFALTLIEPGTDPSKAELALDDHVEDLWMILDKQIPWAYPQQAEKVLFSATNFAYDFTVEVTAPKPYEPPAAPVPVVPPTPQAPLQTEALQPTT